MRFGSELVWFSDDLSARLEDVQFTLGQGPGVAADFGEVPFQAADLAAVGRWPQFAAEARDLGVRALFVWPVRSGAATLGTLTGYRSEPGRLTPQQAVDGLRVADALAGWLLAWQPGLSMGTDGPGVIELYRAEVHQATGALSCRLGVGMEEALVRLRAQAFSSGHSLSETARGILRELPA
ncbi:ANTAR domain-containing protein [Streptomyces sp. CBMA152]|uniref:ANTAR domain-containing protein n=1 Tax=Streptomyces sp. CBMA152 TaxID=1896312 RepID=UPI0016610B3B|nr:ANTAR domain-containing protein [Streptomyces sp. CBMA152]